MRGRRFVINVITIIDGDNTSIAINSKGIVSVRVGVGVTTNYAVGDIGIVTATIAVVGVYIPNIRAIISNFAYRERA